MSRPIGEVPTRTFNPGDVIFKEGDDAKSEAFLVHQGKVEIRKNLGGEEKLLRELSQGMLLGEFALFRNIPRSATAIASKDTALLVVTPRRHGPYQSGPGHGHHQGPCQPHARRRGSRSRS